MPTLKSSLVHLNLQQLGDLEYILLGDLRDVLEEESTEENRKWLSAIVDTLLNTIPREFALRSQGGYMSELATLCPEADSNIRSLESEQKTLCDQLQELSNRLHDSSCFKRQAEILKHELACWSENLKSHNRHEEQLVQDAYLRDLGCGD